jgi:hypothetical protein
LPAFAPFAGIASFAAAGFVATTFFAAGFAAAVFFAAGFTADGFGAALSFFVLSFPAFALTFPVFVLTFPAFALDLPALEDVAAGCAALVTRGFAEGFFVCAGFDTGLEAGLPMGAAFGFALDVAGAFFDVSTLPTRFGAGLAGDFPAGGTAAFGATLLGAALLVGVASEAFFALEDGAGLVDCRGRGFAAGGLAAAALVPVFGVTALGAIFDAGFTVLVAARAAAGFVAGALFFSVIVCPPSLRS